MTNSLIGSISLNISFIIYLVLYLPQVIHNRNVKNIAQLSLSLHFLLFTSYFFDLCYGFAHHLPWQYKTVSIVGLSLVVVQHLQLTKFFFAHQLQVLAKLCLALLAVIFIAIVYFFIIKDASLNTQATLVVGIIARACGLIYCLPQIIKNKISQSANAISTKFIYMNLTIALLDTISSWCLDWGWPNKLAAPVSVLIMMTLLSQKKKYAFRPTALSLS